MLQQAGHPWAQDRHQHGPGCAHPQQGAPVQRSADGPVLALSAEQEHQDGDTRGHAVAEDADPGGRLALLDAAKASAGRPLPPALVAEAAPFFQNDHLSAGRFHDGPVAQRAVAAMGAQAMTIGAHIFAPPAALGNKALIGHELSHLHHYLNGEREQGVSHGDGVTVTDPGQPSEQMAEVDGVAFAAGMETAPSTVHRAVAGWSASAAPPGGRQAAGGPAQSGGGRVQGGQTVHRARHGGPSASGSRHSQRPQRIRVKDLPKAQYITEPTWGELLGSRGGGTSVHAVLGPLGFDDVKSKSDARLPPAIDDAREAYPGVSFKAGHLLNECFGGPGKKSKNLTILTASANSAHRAYDEPLKTAVHWLYRVYDGLSHLYLPIDTLRLGVETTISVSAESHGKYAWSKDSPGKYISEFLYCKAKVRGSGQVWDWIAQAQAQDPDNAEWKEIAKHLGYVEACVAQANQYQVISNTPTGGALLPI
ncbi:DUF4157 domain-containing protein [Streptomyces fildesensis]|uniref:DUF4157 domain-containing protein n=1 Tax=Streptomyces fildesensis TaxID=375757 RepID=A0ABW8CLC8_9ACTN